MERQPVSSKVLAAIGYDADAQTLEVEFRSGRIYQYLAVPASVHEWLMRAPGKGALFNRLVDGKYEFRRVDLAPAPGATGGADLADMLRASLGSSDDSGSSH